MKRNALVSVVIPTYGRSEMLHRAISSVLRQTYSNLEIIVVDDNGVGTSQQIETEKSLERYIKNKQIIYTKHEKNAGGCVARNTGILLSKGDFVGFLDDDDEWLEEFVIKHLEKLTNESVDVVYCNYYSTDNINGESRLKMTSTNKRGYVFNDLLSGWCPATTSMFLIRRECFLQSGYFDESLQSFQDYDMWLSMAKNHQFDYCEEHLIVKYQHGFEQLARNPIKRQNALNTLYKKWKNRLTDEELLIFESTRKYLQKNIYYIEFCQLRKEGNFFKSYKKMLEILNMNNSNIRYKLRLWFILLFGDSSIHKLQIIKKKFIR